MGLPDRTGAILTDEQKQHMQQARKEAKLLVDKLYKQEYSPDVETLWKSLADKVNVKLPRHTHPKASKLIKFAKAVGLETEDWKEGLFGSYYKNSLQKAIDLHNSKLPEGQKESLRTMCCYILEGNYKC
jgi:hypothetical protein